MPILAVLPVLACVSFNKKKELDGDFLLVLDDTLERKLPIKARTCFCFWRFCKSIKSGYIGIRRGGKRGQAKPSTKASGGGIL